MFLSIIAMAVAIVHKGTGTLCCNILAKKAFSIITTTMDGIMKAKIQLTVHHYEK